MDKKFFYNFMLKNCVYLNLSYLSVGSLEKHGSFITHLLSQVRLGMDLTKVVLVLSFSGVIGETW